MRLTNNQSDPLFGDLLWNYASVALLAVGGCLFSVIIAVLYDSAVVGYFNHAYAYYIVLSQIGVLGTHMSVLKFAADGRQNNQEVKQIFASGMIDALLSGVVCMGAMNVLLPWLPFTAEKKTAIFYILPALPFFSANKVALNYINALMRMKAYAVLQSLRNVFICLGILVLSALGIDGGKLTLSFVLCEMLLLVITILYLARNGLMAIRPERGWMKRLAAFGVQILPANIVAELSTKVDLLCMGWFLTDDVQIGVYSFVSMFAEGFYQIYVVVRRQINPKLSSWSSTRNVWDEKFSFLRKIALAAAVPLTVALLLAYGFVALLVRKPEYTNGFLPLGIVAGSIALNGIYIVYGNTLSQLGAPVRESLINCVALGCNFALNCALIPHFGMVGAASATAMSYFVFSMGIKREIISLRKKPLVR